MTPESQHWEPEGSRDHSDVPGRRIRPLSVEMMRGLRNDKEEEGAICACSACCPVGLVLGDCSSHTPLRRDPAMESNLSHSEDLEAQSRDEAGSAPSTSPLVSGARKHIQELAFDEEVFPIQLLHTSP